MVEGSAIQSVRVDSVADLLMPAKETCQSALRSASWDAGPGFGSMACDRRSVKMKIADSYGARTIGTSEDVSWKKVRTAAPESGSHCSPYLWLVAKLARVSTGLLLVLATK